MFYDANTTTMAKETYVTNEGLKKLKAEYDYLRNTKRREIAKRIQDAKELGDLSENAEYASAKDEQVQVEARLAEIKNTLKNIKVINKEDAKSDGSVKVGSKVIAKFGDVEVEYTIVGSNEADPACGLISNESPIGDAFLGHRVGEKVKVKTPEGEVEYKILAIS